MSEKGGGGGGAGGDGNARVLRQAVAAALVSAGWASAEEECLFALAAHMKAFLQARGRAAQGLAEANGRSRPVASDVSTALMEVGMVPQHLPLPDMALHPPRPSSQREPVAALRVGRPRPKTSHYPDFLPPFPDPHTYVRTGREAPAQPAHSAVREAAAQAEREAELSLSRFLLRTSSALPLYAGLAYPAVLRPPPQPLYHLLNLRPAADKDEHKDEADKPAGSGSGENPFLAQPKLPLPSRAPPSAPVPVDVSADPSLLTAANESPPTHLDTS